MTKPVTPQDMFDMWQRMVNPGAYPLQSLMFPVLDAKEIQKKIAELETVEHWLNANVSMLQLTIKSLQYQLAMIKGGEKAKEVLAGHDKPAEGEVPNPAAWAWKVMELHDARVQMQILRLVNHVRPPGDHGVEDADDADAGDVGAAAHAADREPVHPHDGADGPEEGRDGADQGPGARVDEVIIVVLGVRVGHGSLFKLLSSGASRPPSRFATCRS